MRVGTVAAVRKTLRTRGPIGSFRAALDFTVSGLTDAPCRRLVPYAKETPNAASATTTTMDPVKLSPQYYTVRLDNARVHVLEFRLKPGQKEVMHSHPPGIVFALADATVRTYLPDGTSVAYPSKKGDVIWREAVTHSGENVGSTEAHYLAVELKDCAK